MCRHYSTSHPRLRCSFRRTVLRCSNGKKGRSGLERGPSYLPGPSLPVAQAFQSFKNKGMTMDDMVTLLGAHTVGVSHCVFLLNRISGEDDPTADPALVAKIKGICGAANDSNPDPTVFLDQGTSFAFDIEFFRQVRLKRGVLKIDHELAKDRLSRRSVSRFASNATLFANRFGQAMVKMGNIEVLVGNAGEIRKNCRVINP
ncbi:Cycling DOF factor 2, putative isoform 1 [Hibiscus syriacus]|uniref:peroxidase n=1 Tax=Hibiscus syriacus TaxID=106335 RepID=A0A6A2Z7E4_HIBSY|nr:Cycling DOF factor 2, putative isoform 1 [Hibiscus syriacus]